MVPTAPPVAPALPSALASPPYIRPPDPPPVSAIPPAVAGDLYTAEELRARFLFLRRDYTRLVAGTAELPNDERFAALRSRLESYSDALADALGDAVDDASILVRGNRQARGAW